MKGRVKEELGRAVKVNKEEGGIKGFKRWRHIRRRCGMYGGRRNKDKIIG